MKKFFVCITFLCTGALVACGGVPQEAINTKLASTAIQTGKSRLLIYRDEDMAYMGVSARVDMNEQRITELWRGDVYSANIVPGKITFTVDAWSAPGHYTLALDAVPDTTYILEVTPRAEGAYLLGGVVGMGIDTATNENAGAFSIVLKETKKGP